MLKPLSVFFAVFSLCVIGCQAIIDAGLPVWVAFVSMTLVMIVLCVGIARSYANNKL